MMKRNDIEQIIEYINQASQLFESILTDSTTPAEYYGHIKSAINLCDEVVTNLRQSNYGESKIIWSRLVRFVCDSFPWWLNSFSEKWKFIEKGLGESGFMP